MKRKLIFLILIVIIGFFAWRIFVKSFSQAPIEIIPEAHNETLSQILDDTIERSIDGSIEASIPKSETNTTTLKNNKENLPSNSNNSSGKDKNEKDKIKKKKETAPSTSFIINEKVPWGFATTDNRKIDTIVVHSSYDAIGDEPYDLDGLIAEYKQYSVAPHFLIDRKGKVYQLVSEKNIAYHAGVSETPDGRTGVNSFSIGIELMNTKTDEYTDKQYSGLNNLIDYLENKYDIKYVLGHTDIAPTRKTDPWNFNWNKVKSNKSIHN